MAQKRKRLHWTKEKWLYCLYIAKYVDEDQWLDLIRNRKIDIRIYGIEGKEKQVKMGCQNFQWLLTGGRKGLRNVSELQKKVFREYGDMSKEELRKKVNLPNK